MCWLALKGKLLCGWCSPVPQEKQEEAGVKVLHCPAADLSGGVTCEEKRCKSPGSLRSQSPHPPEHSLASGGDRVGGDGSQCSHICLFLGFGGFWFLLSCVCLPTTPTPRRETWLWLEVGLVRGGDPCLQLICCCLMGWVEARA